MNLTLKGLLATALILLLGDASADIDPRDADADMFPADVQFNASIPTPESFLGFKLGEQPVRHHQLVDYISRLAGLSDRLSVEVIGYTHERRPILFVVATSAENHSRIDAIRAQHIALTEPGQAQAVTDDMPMVTWLNYGVHGAESSGMDASLPFIYYLAAAEGELIERVLNDSVVLVTAIFNPDGHAKRAAWFDAYGGQRAISDPAHVEHNFNWQFARTNHYWFDLNRQWLLLTQPEARAWMRKWHDWRPNLTVDYHEMGGGQTYYFHPGVATRTNPLVPDAAESLMERTARTSEDLLDSEGRLYFHGESFDNYYIGKGSTFPLVNGGIGILYEAAAAMGRELETPNGLRTYRENIRKHFRTSIASIDAGSRFRLDYLRYQKAFYENALSNAKNQSTRAWLFSAPGDPARMHHFADLLNFHRIKTHRLQRDISIDGESFAARDSLIVPTNQAQHTLIRGIFERVSEFEDATFYDVSTFTMPPAFGLNYAALNGRAFRSDLLGDAYVPAMPVGEIPDRSSYAYVFEWSGYYAPRALQRLLQEDVLARVATKEFAAITSNGNKDFARGSIIIPRDRQTRAADFIYELVEKIAAEDGISVHALESGRSVTGAAGINVGGPSTIALNEPATLVVIGDDINLYDAGEIWHLLDYRMDMPVTLRKRENLMGIDWSRYTHIVFSSGEYEDYEADYAARLRQWVLEGGSVIGLRDAAPWIRATVLDWVDPEEAALATEADLALEPEEEEPGEAERTPYGDKADVEAVEVLGGAIFAADLDNTHPLGFGYVRRNIHLHKNLETVMEATENPFGTVIAYADEPVFSGYVSAKNAAALAGTPALIAERHGEGSVVLFADNPNFRGYWYGTNKLFLNSLFFSKVFAAPDTD